MIPYPTPGLLNLLLDPPLPVQEPQTHPPQGQRALEGVCLLVCQLVCLVSRNILSEML